MIPHEEAEWRRREVQPVKTSYWGEKESQEWSKKIREERANLAREGHENMA